jgi:hypothetical protein
VTYLYYRKIDYFHPTSRSSPDQKDQFIASDGAIGLRKTLNVHAHTWNQIAFSNEPPS